MALRGEQWLLEGSGGQGGTPVLWVLDQALEFLRENFLGVVGRYAAAMLPFSLVMLPLIDAVVTGHRTDVKALCGALTCATVWRWIALAWMQRWVQGQVAGPRNVPLRLVAGPIVAARAACNFFLTGGPLFLIPSANGAWTVMSVLLLPVLVIPALIATYLSVMVVPTLSSGSVEPGVTSHDRPRRTGPSIRDAMGWMRQSRGRLIRISWTLSAFTSATVGLFLLFEWALISSTLADWVGLDAVKIRVVAQSAGWNMLLAYVIFAVWDMYFHIVGVFLFYDLRARRQGSDLIARLDALEQKGEAT